MEKRRVFRRPPKPILHGGLLRERDGFSDAQLADFRDRSKNFFIKKGEKFTFRGK
jgi:hypothetical protein